MGLFTRSTMRWEIGMKVTVKNLPMHLVFGKYNGQECEVREEFHSRQYGTSLRVRAMDGREFTVGALGRGGRNRQAQGERGSTAQAALKAAIPELRTPKFAEKENIDGQDRRSCREAHQS